MGNFFFVRLQNIWLIIIEGQPSCFDMMPQDASERKRVTGWRSHPDSVQTSWCDCHKKSLRQTKSHNFQEEFPNSCYAETTPRPCGSFSWLLFPLPSGWMHSKANLGATMRPWDRSRFAAMACRAEDPFLVALLKSLTRWCTWMQIGSFDLNLHMKNVNVCDSFWKNKSLL